jgi:hypothetical protein
MLEEIRQNAVVEGTPAPVVTRSRRDGWWPKRPTWLRHLVYWLIALGVASLTAFDRSTAPGSASATSGVGDFVWFGWLVVVVILGAIMGLVSTLRGWEELGAARTASRSLVLFTCLLGFVAVVLFYARRWGVHIEACRTAGEVETCGGQASPQQVLGMLAWHAANVVPVLDITGSLEWHRPARSADPIVGASIIALRLWVAIGILGVLKRLWDKWEKSGSGPAVSP